ncbi:MAG: hypothetical protein KAU95_04425 [Candidatus Aenigmarchaeota archaeon]|nr:hypothetical protein [Candidatus Aenigmarchaeota archaeon]
MRTFGKESLQLISLFELTTNVAPIDCLLGDKIYFVVNKKEMGLVLARGGIKLKTLEEHIHKQVIIFPYMESKEEFVKKIISENVKMKETDNSIKLFINRQDGKRVRRDKDAIKSFLERLYNVKEVLFRW